VRRELAQLTRRGTCAKSTRRFGQRCPRRLEGLVRDYAKTYGEVIVLTGSIVQPPVRTVPSGNVAIPTRYYKILLRTTSDGTLEALTIVLPNLQRGLPLPPGSFLSGPKLGPAEAETFLAAHTASIREVETLTGVDPLRP
jgi:DNA/RNA endonuclease G (NUC1)